MKTWTQGVFLLSLGLLVAFGACRRNAPDLVDRNEAPETELWYAPPDSTEFEYLVHMYWRGRDNDGTVERYIWTIQDTLVEGELAWNPAARLADLRSGRVTTRTDSVFSFTAFRNQGGVGVKKNRQAFYIAAIDDRGVIDPTPAAIEFVATIDQLPRIVFTTYIDGKTRPFQFAEVPVDTVGMYRPFAISYHGQTTNGQVRAYRWRILTAGIDIPGADVWTEDLGDTLRSFANAVSDPIPAGIFRLGAQCRDDANAESPLDATGFREGVASVVVNFDPDTRIENLTDNYTINDVVFSRNVDFTDGIPDTVSYRSWLRIDYSAWDDARDSLLCSPLDPDRCLDFQITYRRSSVRSPGSVSRVPWLPSVGAHDTDSLSASDSNTVSIGSVEYDFSVRAIDENGTADGTPASVHIIGNYDPVLDSVVVANYDGTTLNLATVDTLTWDWWAPADSGIDISDILNPKLTKTFRFRIRGVGHDHPWDPTGSGVKAWRYFVYTDYGTANQTFWPLGRAGSTWVPGATLNVLDDTIELVFKYPLMDRKGDAVFSNLPPYINSDVTLSIQGRDTARDEPLFDQIVFINGKKVQTNSYPTGQFGRVTVDSTVTFHFRMVR